MIFSDLPITLEPGQEAHPYAEMFQALTASDRDLFTCWYPSSGCHQVNLADQVELLIRTDYGLPDLISGHVTPPGTYPPLRCSLHTHVSAYFHEEDGVYCLTLTVDDFYFYKEVVLAEGVMFDSVYIGRNGCHKGGGYSCPFNLLIISGHASVFGSNDQLSFRNPLYMMMGDWTYTGVPFKRDTFVQVHECVEIVTAKRARDADRYLSNRSDRIPQDNSYSEWGEVRRLLHDCPDRAERLKRLNQSKRWLDALALLRAHGARYTYRHYQVSTQRG